MSIEKVGRRPSNVAYKGLLNNRILKRGLEFASDNGALFSAGTCVGLSFFVRPLAILLTPKAKKEDKQYACARSISSALVGFGVMSLVSVPICNAVKKIEKNPDKFLKPETVKYLKGGVKSLDKSKSFMFLSQIVKLSSAFLSSVPKVFLLCSLIPPVMNMVFPKTEVKRKTHKGGRIVSFKGINRIFEKGISKFFDFKPLQRFSKKYKDSNLPQHMFSLNDIFATGLFIHCTNRSKKIDDKRKRVLNCNTLIGTGMTVGFGYGINKLIDKPVKKLVEKFKKANKGDVKLHKYLDGIKVVKPVVILGSLYYIVAPVVSTLLADTVAAREGNNK